MFSHDERAMDKRFTFDHQILRVADTRIHAVHLYWPDPFACAQVLLPHLYNMVKSRPSILWFYTLYRLGGDHLRVRLVAKSEEDDSFTIKFRDLLLYHFARNFSPSSARPAVDTNQEQQQEEDLNILANCSTEWDCRRYEPGDCRRAPYVPEFTRYGGINKYDACLEWLHTTSVACMNIGRAQSLSRRVVLCTLLYTIIISNHARLEDMAERHLGHNYRQWQKLCAAEILSIFRNPLEEHTWINEATASLKHLKMTHGEITWPILRLHLHMIANRLNIPVLFETHMIYSAKSIVGVPELC